MPSPREGFRGACVDCSKHENTNLMTLQMPECVHEKLMMKTEGGMT
jgi:hypothetical protein